jgi:hypothetical protein
MANTKQKMADFVRHHGSEGVLLVEAPVSRQLRYSPISVLTPA